MRHHGEIADEVQDLRQALREARLTRTIAFVIPWSDTLKSSKSSSPGGGRISQPAVSTTWPSSTRVRPIAHGLPRNALAVSKSRATNDRATGSPFTVGR